MRTKKNLRTNEQKSAYERKKSREEYHYTGRNFAHDVTRPNGALTEVNDRPGIKRRSWPLLPLVLALVPLQQFPIDLNTFQWMCPLQNEWHCPCKDGIPGAACMNTYINGWTFCATRTSMQVSIGWPQRWRSCKKSKNFIVIYEDYLMKWNKIYIWQNKFTYLYSAL